MSGTGLLIAPHGAHLANLAFMPARSAVIELFPPLMKKNTYRNLAAAFGGESERTHAVILDTSTCGDAIGGVCCYATRLV